MLADKGTLRRAKNRRALARCAPLRQLESSDGRLRRDHEDEAGLCRPLADQDQLDGRNDQSDLSELDKDDYFAL